MSDVKLLNLDELAVVKRVVQIGGKQYDVAEQTVGQMISRLQLSKGEKMDDPDVFLRGMQRTAQDIIPGAPKKIIDSLTPKMITQLVEFLNDQELDEAAQKMVEEGDKADLKENVSAESGEREKKS
jgi:hypothetical protein